MSGRLGLITLALFFVACQATESDLNHRNNSYEKLKQKVIYGSDDRLNLYDVLDPNWLNYAAGTVALLSSSNVIDRTDHYYIEGSKIGEAYGLCSDEPFYEEPTSAFCSGSLIAKDIIVTAGHCIRSQSDCDDVRFAFNFAYKSGANDDPQKVDKNDIYACKEIIHSEVIGFQGSDFAIIRLNREVVGHTPLQVRQIGLVSSNANLVVIGHPSGLPTKYADGASVRDNLPADYFVANLDTYGGNSGSAVFDKDTGLIEGILVRGERDYVFENGCRKSNVCEDDGCRGEDVTRITRIFDHISADDLEPFEPDPLPEPIEDPNPIEEDPAAPLPPAIVREDSLSACQRSLGYLSGVCSLL